MAEAVTDPAEVAERVRVFVAGEVGSGPEQVAVSGLRRLAGGSSRETWSLDVTVPGRAPLELVMRRDPPGRVGDGDRSVEFRVVRAAHGAGVPVPRVHWCCTDPGVLGTPFYLMDRVAGEALPQRLLRDERYAGTREKMTSQLAAIAAQIHRVPTDDADLRGLTPPEPGVSPARAELDRVVEGLAAMAGEPHPVLDLAGRWLRAKLPGPTATTLVHGDFRVGNVLFDEGGVRAVLDWELCKLGDPVEDLGWLCTHAWRFGSPHPVGGVGEREELLAAYAEASGTEVAPEHLLFWEALGSFKVALVFIHQSWYFRTGRVASLELASLGRRTAEAEEELLRLMEGEA